MHKPIAQQFDLVKGFCKASTQCSEVILYGFKGNILEKDLSKEKFNKSWRNLPWKLRAVITLFLPFLSIQKFLYGTSREKIAKNINVTDLKSRKDILRGDNSVALDELILEERDNHLILFLEKYIQQNKDEDCHVGIIWGAAHMPSIAHYLMDKKGYNVSESDWEIVFKFNAKL